METLVPAVQDNMSMPLWGAARYGGTAFYPATVPLRYDRKTTDIHSLVDKVMQAVAEGGISDGGPASFASFVKNAASEMIGVAVDTPLLDYVCIETAYVKYGLSEVVFYIIDEIQSREFNLVKKYNAMTMKRPNSAMEKASSYLSGVSSLLPSAKRHEPYGSRATLAWSSMSNEEQRAIVCKSLQDALVGHFEMCDRLVVGRAMTDGPRGSQFHIMLTG